MVIACGVVWLGYGPPCVVPHWEDTFSVVAVPSEFKIPCKTAELGVMLVASSVVTEGGAVEVVKRISSP